MSLIASLRHEINRTDSGRQAWYDFILEEAINITATQIPPTGNYPAGRFHSSTTVKQGFFTAETQAIHDGVLTELDMPFVFDLMMGMLNAQPPENADQQEESGVPASAEVITNDLASPDVLSGISYTQVAHAQDRFQQRAHRASQRPSAQ
ncbi:hypothetical protein PtB15_8B815 [Puccinia triticina]|nr:hypothetical protein PtB15_8B815 [Puccinia triticina]